MAGRPRDPELDARILTAALELLAENGYASLAFEAVAQRAGVQRSAIYRRYPGRRELVCDAVQAALAQANPVVPHSADPVGDLRVLLENLIRQLTTSALGGALRAVLPELPRDPALRRLADRVSIERGQLLIEIVERLHEAGRLRIEVPAADAIPLVLGPIYFCWLFTPDKLTLKYAGKVTRALCHAHVSEQVIAEPKEREAAKRKK